MSNHADIWAAPLLAAGILAVGAYTVAVIHLAVGGWLAQARPGVGLLLQPARSAAVLMAQPATATERPDRAMAALSPALYAALAAVAVTVVPWSRSFSIADVETGIVLWGTAEALVIVAMFLHGWSSNSHQPLLAAYRFVAAGVSYLLLSMFVLIAAAIPAESLQLSRIVESQAGLWNVVRQPLGLPLFVVVALGSATWGPLDLADGSDVSGGTAAEASGIPGLVWMWARAAMLAAFAAMSAAVFLGGWHGPVLPGPAWMAVKTVAMITVLSAAGHLLARVPAERFVTWAWVVLLPLGFADLAIAGLGSLR